MIERFSNFVRGVTPEEKDPPPLHLLDEENIPLISKALNEGYDHPEVQFRVTEEKDEEGNPITETVIELKPFIRKGFGKKVIDPEREPLIATIDEVTKAREWFSQVNGSHYELWNALYNKDYNKDQRHKLLNDVLIGAGLQRIQRALETNPQQRVLFEN